jgi:predicted dehydrogenase
MNPMTDRRTFLTTTTTAAAAAAGSLALRTQAEGIPSDQIIKIGLVGCGGRGTGAASQALSADKNVHLVAVGDVFETAARNALNGLKGSPEFGSQVKVEDAAVFSGLDAFQKVIDMVDVVLLATPPGFRPMHFKAAVDAGKNIFCEKPMATDAAGALSFLDSVKKAKEKKLNVVAGFCWRYSDSRKAAFEKLHAGEIGDIRSYLATYHTGPVKPMPDASARDPKWSDIEWQIRNWYNFSWLGGDGLVEQAVHSVDKIGWAMKDANPVAAVATGGRQFPSPGGNIFDHFHVAYEYEDNIICHLASRQIPGCHNENSDYVSCSKGTMLIGRGPSPEIISATDRWRFRGEERNMYQNEHDHLFSKIRAGEYVNDGDWMIHSTILALMGRYAAYTGKRVTWDDYLNSGESLAPKDIAWDASFDPGSWPVPGK